MDAKSSTYIVAVSGGVDSIVLLDKLVNSELEVPYNELIVAHFDHGIREQSGVDAEFVQELAQKHKLKYEGGRTKLGVGASEDYARRVRYRYLRQVCKKYNASGILLAHHQDDLIETAIINLLRGTSWRGLASMTELSFNDADKTLIIRPLLSQTKTQLIQYAHTHELVWREDSTNDDPKYLRNYVRQTLLPNLVKKDPEFNKKLLESITQIQSLRPEIDAELRNLLSTKSQIPFATYHIKRYHLIMWPEAVASEVIYTALTSLDPEWHPSSSQIERALHFAKTARLNKRLQLAKHLFISFEKQLVTFQFKP